MDMLKRKIKSLAKKVAIKSFSNSNNSIKDYHPNEDKSIYEELDRAFYRYVEYRFEYEEIPKSICTHKWVGVQELNGKIILVPNDETSILEKGEKWIRKGNLSSFLFKWTGGCVWNNAIYAFPRTANSFLKIGEDIEMISLSIENDKEHHYSGVCTDNGVVYQPPRNTNYILKTDLKTGLSKKITLVQDIWRVAFRYCGSIIHPNGLVYLFPENGRVIKLNPITDEWCFIGKSLSTMCFDAKTGVDGNIYGYSAYQGGIMKINVANDTVEMIHSEIYPGAYGTKYGLDGCLYSVPGDGNRIWKYDVAKDELKEVYKINSDMKAKFAGGATLKDGTIYCCPAEENRVLVMKPNVQKNIDEKVYKQFCVDNY